MRRGHRATRRLVPALALLALLVGGARADRPRARALHHDAEALLAAGEPARAAALFEQAIAADPDYLPAHEAVIPLWIAAGQLAALIDHEERVTARHPGFAPGWYALAYAYRNQGRDALAVLAYQSYLALRPGEAAPWFGYAIALEGSGEPERARAAYRRYLALERDPAAAGFVDQARRRLAELGADPDEPAVALGLDRARALAISGRLVSAAAWLRALAAGPPARGRAGGADLWLAVGEVALARGQAAAARDAFSRALAADPRRVDALTGLAAAHRALGQPELAAYYTALAAER